MPVPSMAVICESFRTTIFAELAHVGGGVFELFGGSKQERAADADDRHVGGDVLVGEHVGAAAVVQIVVGDRGDGGRLRHAVDVKQGGEHHADFDRHREVGEHGE